MSQKTQEYAQQMLSRMVYPDMPMEEGLRLVQSNLARSESSMFAEGGEVEEQKEQDKEEPRPKPRQTEASADIARPTSAETRLARTVFPDLPAAQAVYMLRGGNRQNTFQGEMLSGNIGARVPLGRDAEAMLMLAGSRPEGNQSSSKALLAALNQRMGEGNVGATLVRPVDAPPGFYAGDMSASYPLGQGRISGNVSAMRMPDGQTGVTGYGVGYGGRVGPGNLSVGISRQANNGPYSGQVEYRLPIGRANGGPVELPIYDVKGNRTVINENTTDAYSDPNPGWSDLSLSQRAEYYGNPKNALMQDISLLGLKGWGLTKAGIVQNFVMPDFVSAVTTSTKGIDPDTGLFAGAGEKSPTGLHGDKAVGFNPDGSVKGYDPSIYDAPTSYNPADPGGGGGLSQGDTPADGGGGGWGDTSNMAANGGLITRRGVLRRANGGSVELPGYDPQGRRYVVNTGGSDPYVDPNPAWTNMSDKGRAEYFAANPIMADITAYGAGAIKGMMPGALIDNAYLGLGYLANKFGDPREGDPAPVEDRVGTITPYEAERQSQNEALNAMSGRQETQMNAGPDSGSDQGGAPPGADGGGGNWDTSAGGMDNLAANGGLITRNGVVRRSEGSPEAGEISDEDFARMQDTARKGDAYRELEKYLQSRDATPNITSGYLPEGINGAFSSTLNMGSGRVKIRKDTPKAAIPSILAHEMTHAADRQMDQQAMEQGMFGKSNQFTEAYEKLVGSEGKNRTQLLRRLNPEFASANRIYRAEPKEVAAHGIGAFSGPNLQDRAPRHVDATAATEFRILMDLAQRNVDEGPKGLAKIPAFLRKMARYADGGPVERRTDNDRRYL